MERSLGKSRNNKCLYFSELLCQRWRLEYKVGMGFCAMWFYGEAMSGEVGGLDESRNIKCLYSLVLLCLA